MTVPIQKNVIEEIKTITLSIQEVESDAVIVSISNWRMRVYFDKDYKVELKKGNSIDVKYIGELTDPHSIKIKKLK